MEPDDPQASVVAPGEPSQAGGAGLGLDPGTVIEVTSVDEHGVEVKVVDQTVDQLFEVASVVYEDMIDVIKKDLLNKLNEFLQASLLEAYIEELRGGLLLRVEVKRGEWTEIRHFRVDKITMFKAEVTVSSASFYTLFIVVKAIYDRENRTVYYHIERRASQVKDVQAEIYHYLMKGG